MRRSKVSLSACLFVVISCSGKASLTLRDSAAGDTGRDSATDGGSGGNFGIGQLSELGVKNVILVHADTLRADHLPMYGYERMTTPNLFRDDYLLIRGYEAAASWTLPSTTTALLGMTPETHGNVNVQGGDGASAATSIAEQLQDQGYATAAFSGSRVIAGDPTLAEGFDVALDVEDLDDVEAQSMGSLWAGARGWLDGLDDAQPFFLWLQPMDTHPPYRPKPPFKGTWADYDVVPMDMSAGSLEQLGSFVTAYEAATSHEEREALVASTRDVYDELILQEDDGIGEIFAWLEETGHTEDTLVVLTSDHGETLSDDLNPSITHGSSLRPELLRVPMVLYHPSLPGESFNCLSSNIDLAPTLLDALGLPSIPGIDGRPIQDGCRDLVFSSLYSKLGHEDVLWMMSVTDGIYKLNWDCSTNHAALYDLAVDPAALYAQHFDSVPVAMDLWNALTGYLELARVTSPELVCEVNSIAR